MANSKEYIAIIADAQEHDIESSEELVQLHKDDALPENSSVFRFELESGDYDVAYLVAQGYFFMNDCPLMARSPTWDQLARWHND